MDLDADRVEVYRLEEDRYPKSLFFVRGETLQTPQAHVPGLDSCEMKG